MRERRRNLIRSGAAFVVGCCLLAGNVFPAAADSSVSGATMRLSSREGTVTVAGKGGKAIATFDNMRLQSGYSLETEAASYAGLTLDDAKAVKMDALSKGEIRKKGKQLELLLSEGSLLCNVAAPLEGDESLSIRTSTMITGIRGTVVYAEVVDSNTSRICVLEGQVLVRPVNPLDGVWNGQYIGQGQQALVIGPDRTEGKGELQIQPLTVENIAPFVLWEICENEELARRLREAGWDVNWIIDNAERLLREEENKNAQWAEARDSDSQAGGKDMYSPLFGGGDSSSDSGSRPERDTVELTMPVSLETIQEKLETSHVILRSTQDSSKLVIDSSLTIPSGKRLELDERMDLEIAEGGSLQVDGSLVIGGKLANGGTIINTSMNTLNIAGDYVGSGTLNNRGRMITGGAFYMEGGSFRNSGQASLEVREEAVIESAEGVFDGNLKVDGILSLQDSKLLIKGGFYGGGITVKEGELQLEGRVFVEGGADAAIFADNSILIVESGVLEIADESLPFIGGTGTLKMDGGEYQIEDLTESMFEKEETEEGWVLTGIVQPERKQAKLLSSILAQPKAENLLDENEEGKETPEGEALPEEDSPDEEKSEEAEAPEKDNPEEEGKSPDEKETPSGEGSPGEEGTPSGEGSPGEKETPSGEGSPGEKETPSGEGSPGEKETPSGEGSPGEEGTPSGEGSPGEKETPSGEGSPGEKETPSGEGSLGEEGTPSEEGSPGEEGTSPEHENS